MKLDRILLVFGVLFLANGALGERRSSYYVPQQRYYPVQQGHAMNQPATPAKAPKRREYSENESLRDMEFDYRYAINNPETHKVKLKIHVSDTSLLSQKDDLFAHVEYANLRRENKIEKVSLPITWDEKGNAYIEVPNLKSQATFRMTVSFRKYNEDRTSGKELKRTGEYYAITSGETDAAKARFKVATAGLIEVADWRAGRAGTFRYQQVQGGWCGTFQQYCSEKFLKVYNEHPTYHVERQGWELPSIAKGEAVHGNHGYVGSHKLMVLDYSEDTGQVYTIEGNWANSVGINRRTPSGIGRMGIITDSMVWKENVDSTAQ